MNKPWTVFLAAVLLVIFAWFYDLNQQAPTNADLIKSPDSPEYTGQKMHTTIYSLSGKKQYLASADTIQYFDDDGRTLFTHPVVHALEIETTESNINGETQSWRLSSKEATLTKDNMLYLTGDVIMQSLDKASKLQRIEAMEATVDLKTQDIKSDSEVHLKGQNFTSQGLKLTGNLKQQIATLKEQVKTHYEINP